MRRIGAIAGGPATLAELLADLLGPDSTFVVPAFTARNSTTTRRFRSLTRGMTREQVAAEEARIPGFDRLTTPAQDVGAFAEFIRGHPGSLRSDHPQTSFAALGPGASELLADHALDCHLGEKSPLAKLYAANALVVLIGVGFGVCSCFHLAEHRLSTPAPRRGYRCYVQEGGRRVLREFVAVDADDRDFTRLGEAMKDEPFVCRGRLGGAEVHWFPLRRAVEFAIARLPGRPA